MVTLKARRTLFTVLCMTPTKGWGADFAHAEAHGAPGVVQHGSCRTHEGCDRQKGRTMATKASKTGFAQPAGLVAARAKLAASGASGVHDDHDDQKARKHRTGRTNRVGSRSSRVRTVIRMEERMRSKTSFAPRARRSPAGFFVPWKHRPRLAREWHSLRCSDRTDDIDTIDEIEVVVVAGFPVAGRRRLAGL